MEPGGVAGFCIAAAIILGTIPVEGSAVVALGPSGQMKRKTPYSFKANYVEPAAFEEVMRFYGVTVKQKENNPLARKR